MHLWSQSPVTPWLWSSRPLYHDDSSRIFWVKALRKLWWRCPKTKPSSSEFSLKSTGCSKLFKVSTAASDFQPRSSGLKVFDLSKASLWDTSSPLFTWLSWLHLISLDYTWLHLISLDYTWLHLISLDYTWLHLISLDYTWLHLISLDYTWLHLISLDYTWLHLISLDYTWFHLISLDYTWLHLIVSSFACPTLPCLLILLFREGQTPIEIEAIPGTWAQRHHENHFPPKPGRWGLNMGSMDCMDSGDTVKSLNNSKRAETSCETLF